MEFTLHIIYIFFCHNIGFLMIDTFLQILKKTGLLPVCVTLKSSVYGRLSLRTEERRTRAVFCQGNLQYMILTISLLFQK
jgi:hypothetical protein